ncbi:helix-turn-helix domain-containing protein [Kitasatospora sp. NPDC059599]|uniref:helix-turn-helix domain-containing protein n=1 Tax=Kitasatospora sp. NPDC059599 TaxID=3346880 RepID=UPI0036A8F8F0
MPGTTAAALGQRIETARHAAGLTRRQVFDVSGVSISMIRKTEGGERWPSDAVLDALARAVQTTPEELLGGPAAPTAGSTRPSPSWRASTYGTPRYWPGASGSGSTTAPQSARTA